MIAPVSIPTKLPLSVVVTLGMTANLLLVVPALPKSTAPLGYTVPTPSDAPMDTLLSNLAVTIPVGLKIGDVTASNV